MGTSAATDRRVRLVTGWGAVATGASGVLLAFAAGGPAGTARLVVLALSLSGFVAGAVWLRIEDVTVRAAVVFAVYAEVAIAATALLVPDRYLGMHTGLLLGVVGTYAVFYLDRRRTWVQVLLTSTVLLVLAGRTLSQHPEDPAGVGARLVMGLLVAVVFPLYVQRYVLRVSHHADTQQQLAHRDPLTGLLNRRGLDAVAELLSGERDAETTTLVVLDLDGFKGVNDRHGHAAGDDVLARLAGRLRARSGRAGWAVRTGGEEFAVVLRGPGCPTDGPAARRWAEELLDVVHQPGDDVPVTASIGVAQRHGALDRAQVRVLMEAADHAMYRAKRAGGARVEVAGRAG